VIPTALRRRGFPRNLIKDKRKLNELKKLVGDWVQLQEKVKFFNVDLAVSFERPS
jgi:hypothetical protein